MKFWSTQTVVEPVDLDKRGRQPMPKGKTRKQIKAKKDREDAKQLKAFRDAVWLRETRRAWKLRDWFVPGKDTAWCQNCGAIVQRGHDHILTGEVHHRISRGNKPTRYDPDNGVLLCNHLVNNCHEKAERQLITV